MQKRTLKKREIAKREISKIEFHSDQTECEIDPNQKRRTGLATEPIGLYWFRYTKSTVELPPFPMTIDQINRLFSVNKISIMYEYKFDAFVFQQWKRKIEHHVFWRAITCKEMIVKQVVPSKEVKNILSQNQQPF